MQNVLVGMVLICAFKTKVRPNADTFADIELTVLW
jgi:hypothetical protein